MKWRKVLMFGAPLMLVAGAALAANSGAPGIDNAITSGVRVLTNDGGAGLGAVGFTGMAVSARQGITHMGHESFGTFLGGAGLFNYAPIAGFFSMSPAVLLHPAVHTAVHTVIHVATRLIS